MAGVVAESSQQWLDNAWLRPNALDGRVYAAVLARPARQAPELEKGAPSQQRRATKSLPRNVRAGHASGPSNIKLLRKHSFAPILRVSTEGLTMGKSL
jgi:hypothetical protein